MMIIRWGVLAGALVLLSACDAVRYPGDGRGEYETPPGAPGPKPPSEPVTDPYGTGENPNPVADLDDADAQPEDGLETDRTDTVPEDDLTDPDPRPDEEETEGNVGEVDTEPEGETGAETTPGPVTETEAGTDEATADNDGTTADIEPDVTEPETPQPPAEDETAGDPLDTAETDTEPEPVVVFSYMEPGQLLPGSGTGATEREVVFAPEMRFPIRSAPAYLQSMVWGFGGGIGGGDQCDARNYAYPWRDNFCEKRSANRNSPFCPVARVHQGQDIRVGTPEGCNELRRTARADRTLYEVVAAEDGVIQSVGTYTVTQRAGPRIYKYMHMNMDALQVSAGDTVTKGQTLGYVSNDFGGTPTTFHLHFELLQNTAESGWVHVPPYTSLVAAYERRENGIGERIEPTIGVASAPAEIPEGFVIIE